MNDDGRDWLGLAIMAAAAVTALVFAVLVRLGTVV